MPDWNLQLTQLTVNVCFGNVCFDMQNWQGDGNPRELQWLLDLKSRSSSSQWCHWCPMEDNQERCGPAHTTSSQRGSNRRLVSLTDLILFQDVLVWLMSPVAARAALAVFLSCVCFMQLPCVIGGESYKIRVFPYMYRFSFKFSRLSPIISLEFLEFPAQALRFPCQTQDLWECDHCEFLLEFAAVCRVHFGFFVAKVSCDETSLTRDQYFLLRIKRKLSRNCITTWSKWGPANQVMHAFITQ